MSQSTMEAENIEICIPFGSKIHEQNLKQEITEFHLKGLNCVNQIISDSLESLMRVGHNRRALSL